MKWANVGGRGFVMLNIDGTWMLFEGLAAVTIIGEGTRLELMEACIGYWTRAPKYEELLPLLV